nr:hypothetical protein [Tanacetum cinerariifolium]
ARIAQSSALPTVADEPASPVRDDSQGEACPTDSSFIADQDRATIANSSTLPRNSAPWGEGSGTPTEPHHIPFPEAETSHPTTLSIPLPSIPTALIPPVTQPDPTPIRQYTRRARIAQSSALPTVADEPASLVRDAQEEEIVRLKERVQVLEDREYASIKGRSINEGEAAAERISNDSEEIAMVLTSMDAATVLAGGIDVPTGSGSIPT